MIFSIITVRVYAYIHGIAQKHIPYLCTYVGKQNRQVYITLWIEIVSCKYTVYVCFTCIYTCACLCIMVLTHVHVYNVIYTRSYMLYIYTMFHTLYICIIYTHMCILHCVVYIYTYSRTYVALEGITYMWFIYMYVYKYTCTCMYTHIHALIFAYT